MKQIFSSGTLLAAVLAMGAMLGSLAGHAEVPASQPQVTLSYAPLVKAAAPAVVNIFSKRVEQNQALNPLFDDPIFRRFFGSNQALGGLKREQVQQSLGSGVLVEPDGVIVTNVHVVKGADEITVVLTDKREFSAKVLTADSRTDIAVLRIDPGDKQPLPYLQFHDSDNIEVGDLVLAIGNPFGVGQTVTSGIISATARTAAGINDYNFFIQTDAAVNPGNSGGALISMDGRLVGINTAIYSRSGGSLGIGFAIPSNMVRTVVDAALHGGKMIRPWLGASGQSITSDLAKSLGLPRPSGVLINAVHPQSPAAAAGLQVGDVVTSINERDVEDWESLRFRLATVPLDSRVTLSVLRNGKIKTVSFAASTAPEIPPREATTLEGREPLAGATIANLSPAVGDELGLPLKATGVVVTAISEGSVAARFGFAPGDIVLRINDQSVEAVKDVVGAVKDQQPRWLLSVQRGDQVLNAEVGG